MKNKTLKLVHYVFLTVFLSTFATMFLHSGTIRANAATAYKELFPEELSSTAQSGDYYFKCKTKSSSNSPVYISTKRTGGYVKTPIQRYTSYSNGKRAYYIRGNTLYYYTFSTLKEHKAQKLPAKESFHFSIAYGNRLFMTGTYEVSDGDLRCRTYSYNVKTKKLKLVKSNCDLYFRTGKYALGTTVYRYDVSPTPLVLYKITSSGLTKIKKLSPMARGGDIVGDKVYYFEYTNFYMSKGSIYQCNLDGSGRKKIATITTPEKGELMFVGHYTDTKCQVSTMEHTYEYTYSTKEIKKIK